MTTKEKLLELFESNKGMFFSGEELAGKLGVSRAAVWKAVKSLREDGYEIEAATNRGYSLSLKTDILSPQGIRKYLNPELENMDIVVLPTAGSTNEVVREKANSGIPEGYLIITNEQTRGRGRCGRDFFSPYGTGIYMSLLLRPHQYSARQAVRITTMAAVAMCEAIEEVSGEKAEIKWVNDIYVKGKKVCGILTEASFGLESGVLEYAVLGAGLNIYRPRGGFPGELEETAGAVFDRTGDDVKNRLAAVFLNRFMKYYSTRDQTSYAEEYRRRSLAIGREVNVIFQNQSRRAFVHGIDDECRLFVEYDDGEKETLSCGEISIRL
ncbi:MAG: biotin--[acetyl-CoA-carboxylase] ligase [Lachnospiraceae bacterium]